MTTVCGVAVARAASLRSDLQSLSERSEAVLREEERLGQPSSDYGHQVAALSKALALYEGAWGCLQQYLQCRHAMFGRKVTLVDAPAVVARLRWLPG